MTSTGGLKATRWHDLIYVSERIIWQIKMKLFLFYMATFENVTSDHTATHTGILLSGLKFWWGCEARWESHENLFLEIF